MFRYFFAPVSCALAILFLSIIPSSEIPEFSLWKLLSFDKVVHAAMYGTLSFQLMKACIRQYANWRLRYNAGRIAVISASVYGGLIELYQQYMTPDRYGDWLDMIANVVGAVIGVVCFRFIFKEYIH
jgi:VanZ family protein